MAILKPYNSFTTDDVTAANFPALKYAWTSDSGFTAGSSWVDRIQGQSVTMNAAAVRDANGAIVNGVVAAPTGTGIAQLPGTADVLMLCIGLINNNRQYGIGPSAGTSECIYVGTGSSTSYVVVDSGATAFIEMADAAAAEVGTSAAAPGCVGMYVDWSAASAKAFNTANNGTHTLSLAGAVTGTVTGGISTLTTTTIALPGGATTALYGLYIMYFENGIPSETAIKAATQWMVANPTKGLYPGFYGLT